MGVQIVSGNLNIFGDQGRFETDRSTWGFANNNAGLSFQRSSAQVHAGVFSARIYNQPALLFPVSRGTCIPCQFKVFTNRKYLIRVWVYVPADLPLVADDYEIYINGRSFDDTYYNRVKISETHRTILQCKGSWQLLETKVSYTHDDPSIFPMGIDERVYIILVPPGGVVVGNAGELQAPAGCTYSTTGSIYVDDFEVLEYVDTVDTCDIDINEATSVVVNESTPSANNGSITIAVTGGTAPFEYSKDNGTTWQASNIFSGLSAAVYQCRVREINNTSCVSSYAFAINAAAADFDFITQITNESIPGANDGALTVTVYGTTGPYQYSKNGGAAYQAGNSFSALPPAVYAVAVKDANNVVRVYSYQVEAGQLLFDKAYFSKNPIPYTVGKDAVASLLPNYRIYCDTRVEEIFGSGIFTSTLKQELEPDENGIATFQLRQAFRNSLKAVPTEYTEGLQILTDRAKLYKNYTGHLTGDLVTPAFLLPSLPFLVLLGGIDKISYPGLNYLSTYLVTNKKFLTWAPPEKEVDALQEDYLTFFVYNAQITGIELMIKLYFDDGTNATQSTFIGASGLKHGQLIQLPAGPLNARVSLFNPAKNVSKYELWLVDQNSAVVSEVKSYTIAPYHHPLTRFIMVLNSLGAWEVHRFTGQSESTESYDRSVVQKYLPHDYSSLDGEMEVRDVTRRVRHSFSSGFIKGKYSAQWLEYFRELAGCGMLYDVTTERIPLLNVTRDFNFQQDQDYQRFIRLEAERVYINESYTTPNL